MLHHGGSEAKRKAEGGAKGEKTLLACEIGKSPDSNPRPKQKQTPKREGLDRGPTGVLSGSAMLS